MEYKRIIQLLSALLLYTITLTAPAKECIAVVVAGSGKNFWRAAERGALQAGEVLGVRIFFRYLHDE